MLLWDACSKYWELTGEHPPLFQIYRGWFMATHQSLFSPSEEWRQRLAEAARITTEEGRLGFFNLMLPLVMKSGV
jgi:hypothetical protein